MFTLVLLFLFLGIICGLLLAMVIFLYLLKVKCPQCKKPKPLKEITVFSWKSREITGKACLKCRTIKKQTAIF